MTFDEQRHTDTPARTRLRESFRDRLNLVQRRTYAIMDARHGREAAEHWAEQTLLRQPDLIPENEVEFTLVAERIGGAR